MRFKCTTEMTSRIIEHEEKMLFEYNCMVEKYKEAFAKYQCLIRFRMEWYNCLTIKQRPVDYRIPLKNGYVCFIGFSVQKNGEDIKLKSDDGEVDYYVLSDSLHITEINWMLVYKKINLFSDMKDFEEELNYFLQMLEMYCTQRK